MTIYQQNGKIYQQNGSKIPTLDYLIANGSNYPKFLKLGKMLEKIPDKGNPKKPYLQTHLMRDVKGLNKNGVNKHLKTLVNSGCVENNGCGLEKKERGKHLLHCLYGLSELLAEET